MRICPKCGYVDPPIWRNTKWCYYTEHCHVDELKVWEPQLAAMLKPGETVFISGVKYHLTKSGLYVHRIPAHLTKRPLSDSVEEPATEKACWNPLSKKLPSFF